MNDWRDQEVRNEARSRDRNEWIEGIRGEMGEGALTEMYVCECGDATCVELIRLTRPEYEAVRDYSTRFAIAVDHENPEIDQRVAECGRYSVVQKIAGRPARIARQTDQRHRVRATGLANRGPSFLPPALGTEDERGVRAPTSTEGRTWNERSWYLRGNGSSG